MRMNIEDIKKNLGFSRLNEMQETAWAACRDGSSAVLVSPTGSGKTLAYLLPLCHRLRAGFEGVQAVVVLPSRELAQQSEDVFRKMKTGFRSCCCYGGRPAMEEHRTLRELRPQVVFSTPGRLNDHLKKSNILGGLVDILVIDEFDKCLELGFQEEMAAVARQLPRVRQLLLTSATDNKEIAPFMASIAEGKISVFKRFDFTSPQRLPQERLRVSLVHAPEKDKLETLARLLSRLNGVPAIVFVSHRESAERIGRYLHSEGFFAETYHGGMEQERRERALYKFRSGGSNILVATDLAARGIDVPETEAVVHYHLPLNEETFVHRSGRTARWEARGDAYLILAPGEVAPGYLPEDTAVVEVGDVSVSPCRPKWCTLYVGRGKKDKLSRADILGFLCKKGGLRGEEIGRIDIGARHAYVAVKRSRLKSLLSAIAGEKIKGMKTLVEEMRH